jgi:hypothetical protein
MIRGWLVLVCGCSFTVTKEPLTYDELSPDQQSAVDRINANLGRMHDALLAQGGPGIDGILCHAEVGFQDLLVAANLGDERARVSTWEDLSEAEKQLVAGWWELDAATTAERYPPMAYDYMALHLAALEYVYVVQGVQRVFNDRPRLNVERDAQRLVAAYCRAQSPDLLGLMTGLCIPMRAQYDSVWAQHYGTEEEYQRYFQENLRDLADPEHPTGYFYYFCRWMGDARDRGDSLSDEMQLIKDRFGYTPGPSSPSAPTCR